MDIFEVIAPIITRSSDNQHVIASRSADRIAKNIGLSLKAEELIKDYSAKNFTGNSGALALATFQEYKNRLSTSFIGSLSHQWNYHHQIPFEIIRLKSNCTAGSRI